MSTTMFGKEMTVEEALRLFPTLLGEKVRVVSENSNGSLVLQFVGDGNYRTEEVELAKSEQ